MIDKNTPTVRVQTVGRVAACRSCGASIVWIKTAKGASMPCDASPVYYKQNEKGKSVVVTANGITLRCEILKEPEEGACVGYMPHWATCNNPGKFRK